jgi:isoquinoline 1-oxidoreductase beta subunit
VRHLKGTRTLTYGDLSSRASKLAVPQNPVLKKESEFRYINTELPRLDMEEKVNGTARFGIDIFIPGMVYAAIARPPQYGAELASPNQAAAAAVPGVKAVVSIHNTLAVCADSIDAAWKAGRTEQTGGAPT